MNVLASIDADDPTVADLMAAMLELLAESGGWLHPRARLVERDGDLGVHCPAACGTPLVRVPHAMMIPVGRMQWSATAEGLRLDGVAADCDGLAVELAYLQVALLNQCRKLQRQQDAHPLLAPLPAALVDAVRAFRPSFRTQPIDPVALLWSTRCFRLTIGQDDPEPVVIPVVDLIDHHVDGARGSGQAAAFTAPIGRPGEDDACFLDYGWQRDAIGMALVYGFADASARIAHSAPVRIEAAGWQVEVEGVGRAADGRLLPIHAQAAEGRARISHVCFGAGRAPVAELVAATDMTPTAARTVIEAVAEANLDLLAELHRSASAAAGPAARVLGQACELQREAIRTYPEHVEDGFLT